jgi:ubiquinone/menaquinone biosynthesis C-methylase UbiE
VDVHRNPFASPRGAERPRPAASPSLPGTAEGSFPSPAAPGFGEGYSKFIARAYDAMADEYEAVDAEAPFFINDYRACDHYVAALRPYWAGRTVLDVGCGTGLQTVQYAAGARRVYALDLAERLIRKAQAKVRSARLANVCLLRADATRIPLPDASVDFVSSYGDVIGHIPDYRAALGEMARVCRPGGIVTLEYDNKWHLGLLGEPRELIRALRRPRVGDLRLWEYQYVSRDGSAPMTFKSFAFREMQQLLAAHGLAIQTLAGIHFLSALIPAAYQTPFRRRLPLQSVGARLILLLGRLDFRLKERFPVSRYGFASIVVAEKR